MKTKKGFTLVELMVVISIIGLLMGLLLPALSSAMATARAKKDSANIRGMNQGMASYAADFNGDGVPDIVTAEKGAPNFLYLGDSDPAKLGDFSGVPPVPIALEDARPHRARRRADLVRERGHGQRAPHVGPVQGRARWTTPTRSHRSTWTMTATWTWWWAAATRPPRCSTSTTAPASSSPAPSSASRTTQGHRPSA